MKGTKGRATRADSTASVRFV